MNTTKRRWLTLGGFVGAALAGVVGAAPVTTEVHVRTESPCIVSPHIPLGLDDHIKQTISMPGLAWFLKTTALVPVDTSLVAFSTDTLICRRAAEAARLYYMGADTGAFSPASVVTVGPTQMVVVTLRELRRNLRPPSPPDTLPGGLKTFSSSEYKAVSVLTLDSSYTVLSRWTWLH